METIYYSYYFLLRFLKGYIFFSCQGLSVFRVFFDYLLTCIHTRTYWTLIEMMDRVCVFMYGYFFIYVWCFKYGYNDFRQWPELKPLLRRMLGRLEAPYWC